MNVPQNINNLFKNVATVTKRTTRRRMFLYSSVFAIAIMEFLTTTTILLLLFYILRNRATNIDNNEIGPQFNPFDSNNEVSQAETSMNSSCMYQGL